MRTTETQAALQRDLQEIARRARSLDELIQGGSETARGAGGQVETGGVAEAIYEVEASGGVATHGAAAAIVERWRFAFSKQDAAAFARRLAWDGWSPETIQRALATGIEQPVDALPDWMRPLVDVVLVPVERTTAAREVEAAADTPVADIPADDIPVTDTSVAATPIAEPPFAEFWVPFVSAAGSRLAASVTDLDALLTPTARHDLARQLLAQLARASEDALYQSFDASRAAAGGVPADPDDRRLYARFVDTLLRGGMLDLFKQYSALARQVCCLIDTWLASTIEMLERLRRDRTDLERMFSVGGMIGRLSGVRGGLSDRHHGGRRVVGLRFESGLRIIYKPRDLGIDVAYNRFLDWLAGAGLEPAPPVIRLLPRENYGWVEFVPQTGVESRAEVVRYYRQAGALLCIAHVLNGLDFHMDNVIAGPAGPVLIDVEPLLQAAPRQEEPAGAMDPGEVPTCLSPGLLAFLQVDPHGRIYDVGGLTGLGGPPGTTVRRDWQHVNRDGMQLAQETAHTGAQENELLVGGKPQVVDPFVEDLVAGFSSTYQLLQEQSAATIAADGPLSWFANRSTRFLFRDSNLYAKVMSGLLSPRFQAQGYSQGVLIDSMNRVFRRQAEPPSLWPLVAEERRALEGLDIPYFGTRTDTTALYSGEDEVVPGFFAASGLEVARERLRGLSAADLDAQVRLIRGVFPAPAPGMSTSAAEASAPQTPAARTPIAPMPWSADPLLRAAAVTAGDLLTRAREVDDGGLSWAPSAFTASADPFEPHYLYEGASGIALLFAALHRLTGEGMYRRAAEAACRPLLGLLDPPRRLGPPGLLDPPGQIDPPDRPAPQSPDTSHSSPILGACNGLGGIIYALTSVGHLLDDTSYMEHALRAARLITDSTIRADRRLDVEGGAAGAILGLLALHRSTPAESWLLDVATRCGEHLLTAATPAPGGGAAWRNDEGIMLAGFGHGAAGIAGSLARLGAATGGDHFLDAAREGYRYERGLFDPERRNWPVIVRMGEGAGAGSGAGSDERSGEGPGEGPGETGRIEMWAWCHGAPGIALARLGALEALDDPEIRGEIGAALETTLRVGVGQVDHLCCGNMGRVEALLLGGQLLDEPGLVRAAGERAVILLQRSLGRDSFGFESDAAGATPFVPGFFRGVAGIAYGLLRLAHAAELPSVLSFTPLDGGRQATQT